MGWRASPPAATVLSGHRAGGTTAFSPVGRYIFFRLHRDSCWGINIMGNEGNSRRMIASSSVAELWQTFGDKCPGDCTSQRYRREACLRRPETVGGGRHRVVVAAVFNR